MRVRAIYSAANRLSCAQYLLDSARQIARHGARPHSAGNVNHLVHCDVAIMLDCERGEGKVTVIIVQVNRCIEQR